MRNTCVMNCKYFDSIRTIHDILIVDLIYIDECVYSCHSSGNAC